MNETMLGVPRSAALPKGITMPEGNYLPESAKNDRVVVGDLRNAYEMRAMSLTQEHREMRELADIVTGRQWTASEKEYLKMLGRLALTFNFALPQLVATEGVSLNSRVQLRAYPRRQQDLPRAEIHTKVLRHLLDEAHYFDHKKRQFSDALIMRRGWIGHYWRYTGRYPDGQYWCERLNPFDVLFDLEGSSLDVNRGRDLIYTRFFTADRIAQIYAASNPQLAEYLDRAAMRWEGPQMRDRRRRSRAHLYQEFTGEPWHRDKRGGMGEDDFRFDSRHPSSDYFDAVRGLYRVIEYHERRTAKRLYIEDHRTGELVPIPYDRAKDRTWIAVQCAMLQLDPNECLRERLVSEYWVTVVAPGLVDDVVLLERPYSTQDQAEDQGFAIKATLVYDFHPDKDRHLGLIDLVKDPQLAANRAESTIEDITRRFINPDIVGVAEDFGTYWNTDWTGPNSRQIGAIRRLEKTGSAGYPEFIYPPAHVAQLFDQRVDWLMTFAERATGINANLQGRSQQANETGILDSQKTAKAEMMLQPVYENLRKSQVEDGRFVHTMACKLLRMPRWIMMLDGGKTEEIGVNQYDPMTGTWQSKLSDDIQKFTILIDQMSHTRTDRERYFNEGMTYLNSVNDPILRLLLSRIVLREWDYGRRDEFIGEINKFLYLNVGPHALMTLDQILAQYGQPGMIGPDGQPIQPGGAAAQDGTAAAQGDPLGIERTMHGAPQEGAGMLPLLQAIARQNAPPGFQFPGTGQTPGGQ